MSFGPKNLKIPDVNVPSIKMLPPYTRDRPFGPVFAERQVTRPGR